MVPLGQVHESYRRLNPPQRTLFGPDLSNPSPRAVQGLIASSEGVRDADFQRVMSEARVLAATVFQTATGAVAILPALEEAAPEAVLSSLLRPRAKVVVGVCGAYGDQLAAVARYLGFAVTVVEAPRGQAVPVAGLAEVVRRDRPDALMVMHGEGATGAEQSLDGLGEACHSADALFLVDAAFTLGGVELAFDQRGIDVAWSGTQRCLSALPGLALVAVSPRAQERLSATSPSYLHLRKALASTYETFPAPLLYALDEVLQLCNEQGMTYRFSRHVNRRDALVAGLEALGLHVVAEPATRLPSVTAVRVPDGLDGEEIRRALLTRFRLEIGGPVDPVLGPVWRIGIMGHSTTPANLLLCLSALEVLLEERGWPVSRGAGARAGLAVLT